MVDGSAARFLSAQGFLLSLIAPLAVILFMSPAQALMLVIVMGQAHFLITYWYQYKAHKLTWKYLAAWALAALALFFGFRNMASADAILLVTGTIFFWHFYLDELRLSGAAPTRVRALLGVAVTLSFGAVLAAGLLFVDALSAAFFSALIIALAGALLALTEADVPELKLLVFGAVVPCMLLGQALGWWFVPIEYSLGLIVLAHYVRWYVHFGLRFLGTPVLVRYVYEAVFIQAVVAGLYIAFVRAGDPWGLLSLLFLQTNFFLFTLLHIFFSYRSSDYVWLCAKQR